MVSPSDARIPVVIGGFDLLEPGDALLLADQAAPDGHPVVRLQPGRVFGHAAGCHCCLPRGAPAEALSRLFLARARGETAFFRRVLAVLDDPSGLRAALQSDRAIAGWYRLQS